MNELAPMESTSGANNEPDHQPVPDNVTTQSQPPQTASVASSQTSSLALASEDQAAAMADLRQTTSLLVDLVKKSPEHTNQTGTATKTDVDYLRAQFATIRELKVIRKKRLSGRVRKCLR